MHVTGFTFIKNALLYDYPIVEAITSIIDLCDDFVVAVGDSEDQTLELIKGIHPKKIKIIHTTWNKELKTGGKVLADETNKALKAVSEKADWCFYIQGDELVHERFHPNIKNAMLRHLNDSKIDGLLFDYTHFYGSYDYVGTSSRWYKNEVRIIKNNRGVYSFGDAQGFRKTGNQKLKVAKANAQIYHYGWVKDPKAMQQKQENFHLLWHDQKWLDQNIEKGPVFHYEKHIASLDEFKESHPKVMQKRIAEKNWTFDYDIRFNRTSFKDRVKQFLKKVGIDTYYKNYILVAN